MLASSRTRATTPAATATSGVPSGHAKSHAWCIERPRWCPAPPNPWVHIHFFRLRSDPSGSSRVTPSHWLGLGCGESGETRNTNPGCSSASARPKRQIHVRVSGGKLALRVTKRTVGPRLAGRFGEQSVAHARPGASARRLMIDEWRTEPCGHWLLHACASVKSNWRSPIWQGGSARWSATASMQTKPCCACNFRLPVPKQPSGASPRPA